MNRLILRALNAPGLILIALLAIALQTSVFRIEWLAPLQPDLLLFLVIWCAMKREFLEGGILVLIFGHLAELHSSVPQGLFLIIYISLYLVIRLCNKTMIIWTWLPLTLAATLFEKFDTLILVRMLDVGDQFWKHTLWYLVPTLLVHAGLAKPIFRLLSRYDLITYKDLAAVQALESGHQPEDEGL